MPDHYKVIFEPEAEQAIKDRAKYIETQSGPLTSERYVNEVYAFCESLSIFPHRGRKRDDLREGIRITNFKGTTIIPYLINEEAKTIYILASFHSSQDYERVLGQFV